MKPEEYDIAIAIINSLIETAEMNNWTNEQWFLDWLDELNKLSEEYKQAIELIVTLIREAERDGETDSQWFLDWIDEINKLSITY